MSEPVDELEPYLARARQDPAFAAVYKDAGYITACRVTRQLAWFRIRGHGLWVKWGTGGDLFTTRKTAHYWGPLRWKVLRP